MSKFVIDELMLENEFLANKSVFLSNIKPIPFTKFPIILDSKLNIKTSNLKESRLSTQPNIQRDESPYVKETCDPSKTMIGFPHPNPIKDPRYLKIKHYQDMLESIKNDTKNKSITCTPSNKLLFDPQECQRSNRNCVKETYKKLRKKTMANRRQFLFYSSQGMKIPESTEPIELRNTFINL